MAQNHPSPCLPNAPLSDAPDFRQLNSAFKAMFLDASDVAGGAAVLVFVSTWNTFVSTWNTFGWGILPHLRFGRFPRPLFVAAREDVFPPF
jgi:hypothetical protein